MLATLSFAAARCAVLAEAEEVPLLLNLLIVLIAAFTMGWGLKLLLTDPDREPFELRIYGDSATEFLISSKPGPETFFKRNIDGDLQHTTAESTDLFDGFGEEEVLFVGETGPDGEPLPDHPAFRPPHDDPTKHRSPPENSPDERPPHDGGVSHDGSQG